MSKQLEFLVVDDNHVSLIAIRQMLEAVSIHTECCDSPEIAIEMMRQKTYDMILIDLYMPLMSGVELYQIMQKHNLQERVPVIAISGNDLTDSQRELADTGFTAVLQKPVTEKTLLDCLKQNLGSKQILLQEQQEVISAESYEKMQRLTIMQINRFSDELAAHLMAQEYDEIQKQCHALISPLGFIHETELSKLAALYAKKSVKEEIDAGNYEYYVAYIKEIQDFQSALIHRAAELEQAMSAYNNRSIIDNSITLVQSLSQEEIMAIVKEIKEDIKRFEYIKIVKKLNELRVQLQGTYQENVNQAVVCMDEFNYDGAFNALGRLEELCSIHLKK